MPASRRNTLRIDSQDNVAVALEEIPAGSTVACHGEDVVAATTIPFAHKIALVRIGNGTPVLKYGVPIAFATADIEAGAWVHEHNAKSYFVAKKEEGIR